MDLRELSVLNTLKNLKSVIFHNNVEDSNPFCRIRIQYLRALSRLKCINAITVDGLSVEDIVNEERGVTTRNSEDDMDPEVLQLSFKDSERQRKQKEEVQANIQSIPKKIKKFKLPQEEQPNFMNTNSMNNTHYTNQMNQMNQMQPMPIPQYDQLSSKYEELKMDMVKVQTMLRNSEDEKHKLSMKMETTEKYWINKVKGLEENYRQLLDKLEGSRKDVETAEKSLNILNQENKRVSPT